MIQKAQGRRRVPRRKASPDIFGALGRHLKSRPFILFMKFIREFCFNGIHNFWHLNFKIISLKFSFFLTNNMHMFVHTKVLNHST